MIVTALVTSTTLAGMLVAVGQRPASADVLSVSGSAFGYYVDVGVSGGPRERKGYGQASDAGETAASPSVILPPGGSSDSTSPPITAHDPDGAKAQYGSAVIFGGQSFDGATEPPPSGPISVSTGGSAGVDGPSGGWSSGDTDEVQSWAKIGLYSSPSTAPGGIGPGPLIADEALSHCWGFEGGVGASTRFVEGTLDTKFDKETQVPIVTEAIPVNPPPNYTLSGTDHLGDRFTVVFNEQIIGADSITVNAAHMYLLGPRFFGDMVVASSTCSVALSSPNPGLVAVDDTFSTDEDTPLTGYVLGNDIWKRSWLLPPDCWCSPDSLVATNAQAVFVPGPGYPAQTAGSTYAFPSDPPNGTVTINRNGTFTYIPDADFAGTDTFSYVAHDSRGADEGVVTVTVNPVPDAPVAAEDSYGTSEDITLTVPAPGVLGNDTDAEGEPLTAGSAGDPGNGSVTLDHDGAFTYIPEANFAGIDSFAYTISDGQGGADTALVTITVAPVNDVPVAADDAYSTASGSPVTVSAPGVLGNDADADGDSLSAGSATDPAGGSVTLNPDGSFTYTPDAGFSGSDGFTYAASDGQGGTDTATVTVTVTPQPPTGDTRPTQLSVSDVSVAEGNSGSTVATFTVTRLGVLSGPSTVMYKTSGGTATAGVDYAAVTTLTTLSFAAEETTKTVNVAVTGDALPEATETFSLVLSSPTGTELADASGTATVLNDDGAAFLAVGNITVDEGNADSSAMFRITRSGNTNGVSTVKYKTANGTAGADDFAAVPLTTVSFGPGETSKDVTVTIKGDALDEKNETFTLALSAPVGATVADTAGTATVVDDEGPITPGPATFLSVDNLLVNEGNSGATPAVFTVSRTGDTSVASTVKYRTSGGTAGAGGDYSAIITLSTLNFAAGETSRTVPVEVLGDGLPEADETFNLILSAPTEAAIADTSGTATIINDDGAAYLAIDNVAVNEGNAGTTQVTFTVTRSGNATGASSVNVRTSGGTAAAGTDYTAVPLTMVDFAAGDTAKSVAVDITGDITKEANETVNLVLSTPTGAVTSDASGGATIVDDD